MRKSAATGLGILLVILGVAGVANAQNWIQIQGRLQAVDCRTNAVVLNAPDGTHVFPMASNAAVFINSVPASFCTLRQYVGGSATVSVAPTGNQLVAGRVDVFTAAAPPVPPPPAPSYGYYGPYYGGPYCYSPYYGGPYYASPYCSGPYAGYYPYYGPAFGFGIGIVIGPGFHRGDRRFFVAPPRFHGRDGRFVAPPRFHGRDGRFVVTPGFHGGRSRR
jgi:hypothetical protein